jgi:PAS domain S-box-containing protein
MEERTPVLSGREKDVLLLASEGLTDKEICSRLNLTRSTIQTHWMRMRGKFGASSRGQIIAMALSAAYKQAEREIRIAHDWIRIMVDCAEDYAIFLIGPNEKIKSWNPGVLKVLGFEREEFIGLPFENLFTAGDRAGGAPEMEINGALENGRSLDQRWHMRRDNSRVFVSGVLVALRDEDGSVRGFAKIMKDETYLKHVEDELQQMRDKLEMTAAPAR